MANDKHTNESVINFLAKYVKDLDDIGNADALEDLRDQLEDMIDSIDGLVAQYEEEE